MSDKGASGPAPDGRKPRLPREGAYHKPRVCAPDPYPEAPKRLAPTASGHRPGIGSFIVAATETNNT